MANIDLMELSARGSERMEINSPGALPRTVPKEQFLAGRAAPYWKNQTLAYFFNKLQLAQADGYITNA